MNLAAPTRRTLGLAAVSAIAMSTTLLSLGGVASATDEPLEPLSYSTYEDDTGFVVPEGYCTVEWNLQGADGGRGWLADDEDDETSEVVDPAAGAGKLEVITTVTAGQTFSFVAGETGDGGDYIDGGGAGGAGAPAGAPGLDITAYDADVDDDVLVGGGGGGGGASSVTGPSVSLVAHGGKGADATYGGAGGGGITNTVTWAGANVVANTQLGWGFGSYVSADVLPCIAPPLAPTGLWLEAGNGFIDAGFTPEWNEAPNSDQPDTWEYKLGNGAWTSAAGAEDEFAFRIPGLTNGVEYSVQVRGISETGVAGAASDVVKATPVAPIGAPANVVAAVGPSSITITWDAPASPGTLPLAGYIVGGEVLSVDGLDGASGIACETTADVRKCVLGAEPGWVYSFGVTPFDIAGNPGVGSEVVTIRDIPRPSVPNTVPAKDGDLQRPAGQSGSVAVGSTIQVTGGGYLPNSAVTLVVYSDPQVLTTTVADGNGFIDVTVTVPAGLASGSHTLVAVGVDENGNPHYLTLPITVTGGTTGSGGLAYTGASVAVPAIGGLAALAIGGGLVLAGKRRRTAE